MKKIEYIAPEVQVIVLKSKAAILSASPGGGEGSSGPGGGGLDD